MFSFLQRRPAPELHSRRWEAANLAGLRKAFAKLDKKTLAAVLRVPQEELVGQLVVAMGLSRAAAEALLARHCTRALMAQTVSFFELTLKENDYSKEAPLLPRTLVYHDVQLHLPPAPPNKCELGDTRYPRAHFRV